MDRLRNSLDYAIRRKTQEELGHKFIYIIRCNEFYNIGVADNVTQRLTLLQIGNPYKLEVVKAWRSIDPENEEKHIHGLFEAYRIRGEWFRLPTELIEKLK